MFDKPSHSAGARIVCAGPEGLPGAQHKLPGDPGKVQMLPILTATGPENVREVWPLWGTSGKAFAC